jgi:3-deoxy-D-manno-octulosonic-acid transferase
MLLGLYRQATRWGGPLIEAQLRRRVRRGKEDRTRWRERLGAAGLARPDGRLLWLHAASVGESLSVLPLTLALLAERSALHVLLTTGTVMSAALLREQLPFINHSVLFILFISLLTRLMMGGFGGLSVGVKWFI